jgi:hypothetical protein
VRQVKNEAILIDALRAAYGEHTVTVWTGAGLSLPEQIRTFRSLFFYLSFVFLPLLM